MSAGEEGIIRMHRFDKSYFEDSIFEWKTSYWIIY
jgi:hypothetical protein